MNTSNPPLAPGSSRVRLTDRQGFLLPFVLLAVLAITSLALAALTLASAEHEGVEWQRAWVAGGAGAATLPGPAPDDHQVVAHLHGGFRVVQAREAAGGAGGAGGLDPRRASPLRLHHLAWCLDPVAEGAAPWAPTGGPLSTPLPPQLGPVPVEALLEEGGVTPPPVPLPSPSDGAPLQLLPLPGPDGMLPRVGLWSGTALGRPVMVLAAEGDLALAGAGEFSGVILLRGTLTVGEGVRVRGGVRAGGGVVVEGAGAMDGDDPGDDPGGASGGSPGAHPLVDDPAVRRAALSLLPTCPVLVHLQGRLGRF